MRIDHVIYAAPDLASAAIRFKEEHGLVTVGGGRHEGLGTGNIIVPLGTSYLEIVSILDEEEAGSNAFGRRVLQGAAEGGALIGWAVAVDDLDDIAERRGIQIVEGSRSGDEGEQVRWRFAGLEEAADEPYLPFFIEWDVGVAHPGSTRARHDIEVQGIDWIEVGGDESKLRAWLDDAPLPFRVMPGEPGVHAVAIRAADSGFNVEIRGGGATGPAAD